jgi:error-prone DNA polymerase
MTITAGPGTNKRVISDKLGVELHVHTAYSFGQGASLPEEYVLRAGELGYHTLAITDRNSLAGVLEYALAAKAWGIKPVVGAEISLRGSDRITLLAENRRGYGNLCRLITLAHAEDREHPELDPAHLEAYADGLVCLTGGHRSEVARASSQHDFGTAEAQIRDYIRCFGPNSVFLEVQNNLLPGDTQRNQYLEQLADETKIKTVASGDVHYHTASRHRLQDVITAIDHNQSLNAIGPLRYPNDQFYLRSPFELKQVFRSYREAVVNAEMLAERCAAFDITRDLGYKLPAFDTGDYGSAEAALAYYCRQALDDKYDRKENPVLRKQAEERLEEELGLISSLGLSGFFLVYRDLVNIIRDVSREVRGSGARSRSTVLPVLGRGSSVSSVVCYLIGLSRVDPVATKLYLQRFLNEGLKGSLPDIDVDMARDIREQVILRVYQRYGHDHAAMVAAVSTYHIKGAVRDVGKALGLPPGDIDRMAKLSEGGSARDIYDEIARRPEHAGRMNEPIWRHFAELVSSIAGFPRYLGQHTGGMVISSAPLVEMVPIMPSAIEGRFICQWDKDSCDDAGFAKLDLLGLGMLSATEDVVDLIAENGGPTVDLGKISYDDASVYDMLCQADSISSFQMGSRAQRQLLFQTQPRNLKELADQDALVRPGAGNGGGARLYARRKHNLEPTVYDHPKLEPILESTYGVMVFQDQALQASQAIGGFSAAKADALRRALSRRRSHEAIASFWEEFRQGALAQGISEEIAERVFKRIEGFSAYGYPQSHAFAFAQLAYQTMWLKRYYPAQFLTALANNFPLGFYSLDVLIKDAQRHGVLILSPDINLSSNKCTIEGDAFRLGLSFVKGVGDVGGKAIEDARHNGHFRWLGDLTRRADLSPKALKNLILIGACAGFGLSRRELLWQLNLLVPGRRLGPRKNPVAYQPSLPLVLGETLELPGMSTWERMLHDYGAMGLSARYHPMGILRPSVARHIHSTEDIKVVPDGTLVSLAGMVIARQRPENAKGFCFLTIQDEFSEIDVVIRPPIYDKLRDIARGEPMVLVSGSLERGPGAPSIVAEDIRPLKVALPQSATLTDEVSGIDLDEIAPTLDSAALRLVAPSAHYFGRGIGTGAATVGNISSRKAASPSAHRPNRGLAKR